MTDDDTTDRLDRLESLVERQAETIETLRDQVSELIERTDGDTRPTVSRRTALKAGGLLALLGVGAGTASADPQGQVGTDTDPLTALYSEELNGGVTGNQPVTDLVGDGLAVDAGALSVSEVSAWGDDDGDNLLEPTGSETGIEVSTVRSPAGEALGIDTDDGARTLELGVPGGDGAGNTAGGNVVAGHPTNVVQDGAGGVAIGGGGSDDPAGFNGASDHYATVSGGEGNRAGSDDGDPTTATHAVVGGGFGNVANGPRSVVGGGQLSQASGNSATIAGGDGNAAGGSRSAVGGGKFNEASGNRATIGGGELNEASGNWATVAGGQNNTASGLYSFAAGREADADENDGAFVWGDGRSDAVTPTADDQFVVQAGGGVYLGDDGGPSGDFYSDDGRLIDTSTGAHLTTGGTWTDSSSRTVKEGVESVDPETVLAGVESLPVSEWSYRDGPDDVRHVGPMAEDFHATFGLGADDEHIASLDTAGVALAAIQGLAERLHHVEDRLEATDRSSAEETTSE